MCCQGVASGCCILRMRRTLAASFCHGRVARHFVGTQACICAGCRPFWRPTRRLHGSSCCRQSSACCTTILYASLRDRHCQVESLCMPCMCDISVRPSGLLREALLCKMFTPSACIQDARSYCVHTWCFRSFTSRSEVHQLGMQQMPVCAVVFCERKWYHSDLDLCANAMSLKANVRAITKRLCPGGDVSCLKNIPQPARMQQSVQAVLHAHSHSRSSSLSITLKATCVHIQCGAHASHPLFIRTVWLVSPLPKSYLSSHEGSAKLAMSFPLSSLFLRHES